MILCTDTTLYGREQKNKVKQKLKKLKRKMIADLLLLSKNILLKTPINEKRIFSHTVAFAFSF